MKKTVRTVAIYLFAALSAVFCVFLTAAGSYLSARATAYAATLTGLLDKTSIENDLKELDLSGYSAEDGLQIVYFAEIGFSRSSSEDYGLYVYVYNPDGIAFNTSLTGSNVLNMAVSFNSSGEASGYRNMELTFIDRTDDYLYYKFKVTDSATMYSTALSYAETWNCRRYEIAGVQLWENGADQAQDYEVALAYIYSGYAKGYSTQSAEESTLSCTVEESRVITFSDLQQTYYRYPQTLQTSAEIKTVYFSIPNEVLDYYGTIYSIQAEYYEYDLQPIVIVEDSDVYNGLKDYVGVSISSLSRTPYAIYAMSTIPIIGNDYYYNWVYKKGTTVIVFPDNHYEADSVEEAEKLVYLFYASDTDDYTLSREELISYMDAYTAANGSGTAYGGYNDDLFYSSSAGYSGATYIDITADDLFDIDGFDLGSSFKNWWVNVIKGVDFTTDDLNDIEPIHVVTENDLKSSELSNTLYVAEDDVDDFVTFCKQEMAAGNTVYMFRYKVDSYADEEAHIYPWNSSVITGFSETYGSVRFATVDLGFDIISLGFMGENGLTIVAAVSDPINVIPDMESAATIIDNVFDTSVSWLTITVLLLVGVGGIVVTRIIKKYAKNI